MTKITSRCTFNRSQTLCSVAVQIPKSDRPTVLYVVVNKILEKYKHKFINFCRQKKLSKPWLSKTFMTFTAVWFVGNTRANGSKWAKD